MNMELNKIEELLEKYFEGNSNEQDEQKLRAYFAQENIAEHLVSYRQMFVFFEKEQTLQSTKEFKLESAVINKSFKRYYYSIAASVILAIGAGIFVYTNNFHSHADDLGSFNDPKKAMQETQKALSLLSKHVNTGYESVQYIEEYETTKDKIFNLN